MQRGVSGTCVSGERGMIAPATSFIDALLRAVAGFAYPGRSDRLPIIVHHRVLAKPDPLLPETIDAQTLDAHLEMLSRLFVVLPLDEAVDMAIEGRLPSRAVAITFDDGYRNNVEVALPILRKYRLPATVYLASSFLDGGRLFVDTAVEVVRRLPEGEVDLDAFGLGRRPIGDLRSRLRIADDLTDAIKYRPLAERDALCERLEALAREPLPTNLMMTSEQVTRASREGITFGGHTVHHPNLALLDDAAVMREIADNRDVIKSLTGRAPRSFAYPFGKPGTNYTAATMDIVRKAGYTSAVSMSWGVANVDTQRYQLPRFGPSERRGNAFYARILKMARHSNPPLLPATVH
jgi:peptidoglycan/xylan/chitin deacetylase (PgdA/CDA1 family)